MHVCALLAIAITIAINCNATAVCVLLILTIIGGNGCSILLQLNLDTIHSVFIETFYDKMA